ncbi:MAG: hypothetical protein QHC78_04430 [Pigmentiphaga sp.]|uniref:hypothetical protein n=1 Tax=Pigmentiphaga sp. TaxID=1977564 RepID=UPI0029A57640|nr:hypothetical protein [Pigmentiphaga sp.]MDX3904919.1 hypothetical protein [Pigmentiphaga sp.]
MPILQRAGNTLLKLLYRYSHSRRHRHNERLWPHVKIQRDASGHIRAFSYRGRPFPLADLAGARRGSRGRCHIIASGPSINDIDYARLPLEHVMGVNGAIALSDRSPVRFDYYCFNDTGFVRARPDLVRRIVAQDLLLFTTPLCLWHVLQRVPAEALRCRLFLMENPQWPALQPARTLAEAAAAFPGGELEIFDADKALGFSHDVRKGVFDVGTVAYTALQIMAWQGYAEIVLHGVDLKNAAAAPRFYETAANRQPTTLDQYVPHHIVPAFRQAARRLREAGVRIVNLSPDSALEGPEFDKRHWQELASAAGASSQIPPEVPWKTGSESL